uniref:RIMS-binding protein 2 n=1 Tax=Gadus morhua TaxID=8049 RepID=A0A8C5FBC4_GADMO
MREAAERRQQLELEHEQALAVLNAKQQEIDLLQKAKVRELEEKCRNQSEQFNLLSKELEKFRLQAGTFDILSTEPLTLCESPGSPSKSLSQLLNGLACPLGKGNEAPMSRSLISEFIRPLQMSGDKPDLLSLKPTFLTRGRDSGPRQTLLSEVCVSPGPASHVTAPIVSDYNPYDGPNEHPEAELPLVSGKYLYVYGTMDEDGFYEGELLDGQQGLVPSNFVDFVQDEEKPAVQNRDGAKDNSRLAMDLLGTCSNGTGTLDVSTDEVGEDVVPYPRRINLIKQLAKSVIVGWEPPVVPPGWGSISGYNVLVDDEVRMSVPYGGRTKSLIERLNLATSTYRVSVQCITERGLSDRLRCSLLVGKEVVVAPYYLRVDNITQVSAELSWMPSNSNYSHNIFLNGSEYDMVKAGGHRYQFFNLKPMTVYKVKVVAREHQVPWQLPLEHREKREISVEFCTQHAGPPFPPQEVQVQCGPTAGIMQVRWKPPDLSAAGTSNGANVIGYAVCTKGQKIAEVMFPTADYVSVEVNRIQGLEAREVIVRTLSAQGESQDSPAVQALPSRAPPHTLPHPQLHTPPPHHHHHPPPPHFPPHAGPQTKPLLGARDPDTKDREAGLRAARPWERSPSPLPPCMRGGPHLEPPYLAPRRSPSPQRILPQPQGAPIPNTIAKAMAREAAQRVFAEGNRAEKRNIFRDRGMHSVNSDEEEDGYDASHARRRGASVDEFLRGSELGQQVHCSDYHTESSRGSDLSDIMEEDEEDLYSEMQLEEGRRRSINSHSTLKIIGNSASHGHSDRQDHSGRRSGALGNQRRPIPSIDGYGVGSGRRPGRARRSSDCYEESEADEMTRIFVALFDYDPLSMSPNPDAAREELPFKEGQILKVFGKKDTDGFYRAEIRDRSGLIPCNMVSEIQTEDDDMMLQLLKQGFLPLNTPVERLERNRRSGRQLSMSTRRMVALYDYDPRESSPNVDVEAELTFCAGDVIVVFGEIDEDGFYYGELNGHKGLIPSNFLEEVPDDVEVFLSDPPSRYPPDHPGRIKTKRVHAPQY